MLSACGVEEPTVEDDSNVVGRHDFTRDNVARVSDVYIHPDWDPDFFSPDFALLKLTQELDDVPRGTVEPEEIALVEAEDAASLERPGRRAHVFGWGTTEFGTDNNPDRLRTTRVPLLSNQQCGDGLTQYILDTFNEVFDGNQLLDDNMICAGRLRRGGRDACQGDSGGPLAVRSRGERSVQVLTRFRAPNAAMQLDQ